MSQLTATEALALSAELSLEVKARQAALAANPYDASKYAWRSDGKCGNTLSEIQEIKAYGFPLPSGEADALGYIHYKGFQYEGQDGFLEATLKMFDMNEDVEESESFDPFELLYLVSDEAQEKTMLDGGYEEVTHNNYGRGYILESKDDIVKVYFMNLVGETPTMPRGANIRWVKRTNLL